MSNFLDELARAVAKPMPRSRALRLIGGAVVSASVPLARPGPRSAGAASFRAKSCGDPGTCANPNFPKVCGCNFLAGCYRDCCAPTDVCCIFPPSSQTGPPCEKACCPAGSRCGSGQPGDVCVAVCNLQCGGKCCQPGEYCANFRQQLCCKKQEVGCGPRCCKPNEECVTIRVGGLGASACRAARAAGRAAARRSAAPPTGGAPIRPRGSASAAGRTRKSARGSAATGPRPAAAARPAAAPRTARAA